MRLFGQRWVPAFAAMTIALAVTPASLADPLTVTATPISSFGLIPQQTRFGVLEWRGGLELESADERLGGLSGLALSKDGTALLAVSDRGFWFKAHLTYADGRLAGIGDAELAPLLDSTGKLPKSKVAADAEALASWTPGVIDGKMIVGFESRPRAGLYDLGKKGFAARFSDLNLPKEARKGPPNRELEAIGRLPSGSLIAISESNRDQAGNILGWVWGGKSSFAFAIKPLEDYAITDLAVLAGGDVLTVERGFGAALLPGLAVRRISAGDIRPNAVVEPLLLFSGRAPFHAIDNMEGIAVSTGAGGETRVTLVSDNNYNPKIQRTLILQFALKP